MTLYFWITKVLTTGMGETTSDFMATHLNQVIAVALGGLAFAAALMLQFSARRYTAWIYWTAVVMVSVFGTMAADVLHVALGIPYAVSTAFFTVVLAAVLGTWYAVERTLSIHSIHTRRREGFYWATVMATFALGTAAGDWTATTLHLGYFSSGVLFAVLIAVPTVAHRWFRMNPILAFWFAYIVTRPLGASFADWMAVSRLRGGLAWGTGPVSLAWAVVILGFVAFLAFSRKDVAGAETGAETGTEPSWEPVAE
ncbi:COG4705 family protein [Streptacidiphilus sp. PAMC 29251]